MHRPLLWPVVVNGAVLRAAVVPEAERPLGPSESDLERVPLLHEGAQVGQELRALLRRLGAVDRGGEETVDLRGALERKRCEEWLAGLRDGAP